jgi:hypothetical protein
MDDQRFDCWSRILARRLSQDGRTELDPRAVDGVAVSLATDGTYPPPDVDGAPSAAICDWHLPLVLPADAAAEVLLAPPRRATSRQGC